MSTDSKNNFVKYIRQAKNSPRPSHSKAMNMYLVKIVTIGEVENFEIKNCFLVDEIEGVTDLYFSKIDAGKNCENSSFKYLEGSVKTPNFLTR